MQLMLNFKNGNIRFIKVEFMNTLIEENELNYLPTIADKKRDIIQQVVRINLGDLKAVGLNDEIIYMDEEEKRKYDAYQEERLEDALLDLSSIFSDEEEFDA